MEFAHRMRVIDAVFTGLWWAAGIVAVWHPLNVADLTRDRGRWSPWRRVVGPVGALISWRWVGGPVPLSIWAVVLAGVPTVEPIPVFRLVGVGFLWIGAALGNTGGFHLMHVLGLVALGLIGLFGVIATPDRNAMRLYLGMTVVIIAGSVLLGGPDWVTDGLETLSLASALGFYLYRGQYWQRRWHDLTEQAERDPLTGALTRYGYAAWQARHPGATGLVMVWDIDGLKTINDTLGHAVGDELIRQTSQRLQGALRPNDCVVRWGGDEFLCVMIGVDPSHAALLVERIHHHVTGDPWNAADHWQTLAGSAGWAIGPLTDQTIAQADAGLLHAKRQGKNRVVQGAWGGSPAAWREERVTDVER